jgi:hypothetical protein
MGLLDGMKGKDPAPAPPPEHSVLVAFEYGSTDLSELFALEEQLEAVLASTGAGDLDGNEVAVDGSDGTLFLYGPDADALLAAIRPTLEAARFMKGAHVTLLYGPEDDAKRVEFDLEG